MDFIDLAIQEYSDAHTTAESELLQKLNRDTNANVLQPRMLSGHFQGRLLSMLSKLVKPKTILEIGTYTGYSALCLAEGLAENGKLITIDINAEREEMVTKYIAQAGMDQSILHIIGDALNIIPTLPYTYDLIFIDADKPNYVKYYDLVIEKANNGALLLIDNVLWSGKVLDEKALATDKDTQILHALNEKVQADQRVENILLPVRDGLMVLRKR